MAYRIQRVSPSALPATAVCPRFRPNGEDNDAAAEGTMLHACLEELVLQPSATWENWIRTREISSEHMSLLEEAVRQLRGIVTGCELKAVPDMRLRLRGGKPRRSPLKPGIYPEVEIDRGGGRHGYIDVLIVMPDGRIVILDWKFERGEKDHWLQLAAYACDVNRLCPAHDFFECRIVAPRLRDAEPEVHMFDRAELEAARRTIAAIEERADRSANDPSIPGCPNDACGFCHWSGSCPYQSDATVTVADRADITSVIAKGTPFAGMPLTLRTLSSPADSAERGFRRMFMKCVSAAVDAWKKDDTAWLDAQRRTGGRPEIPGWNVRWQNGKSTLDSDRMEEVRSALMSKLGMTETDVMNVSKVDRKLLVEFMAVHGGLGAEEADLAVEKVLDPYMKTGAAYPVWTQAKGARVTVKRTGVRGTGKSSAASDDAVEAV